jgi:hypothetical protein
MRQYSRNYSIILDLNGLNHVISFDSELAVEQRIA